MKGRVWGNELRERERTGPRPKEAAIAASRTRPSTFERVLMTPIEPAALRRDRDSSLSEGEESTAFP